MRDQPATRRTRRPPVHDPGRDASRPRPERPGLDGRGGRPGAPTSVGRPFHPGARCEAGRSCRPLEYDPHVERRRGSRCLPAFPQAATEAGLPEATHVDTSLRASSAEWPRDADGRESHITRLVRRLVTFHGKSALAASRADRLTERNPPPPVKWRFRSQVWRCRASRCAPSRCRDPARRSRPAYRGRGRFLDPSRATSRRRRCR